MSNLIAGVSRERYKATECLCPLTRRPVAHSLRELEALQSPDAGLIARDAIGGHGPRALSTLRESLSRVDGDITTNSCRLY
jgi:hypothetical protein